LRSGGGDAAAMEEAAFAPFYRATYPALRAYVARGVGDPETADDLTQEAFVRLLQARTERFEPAQLKAYLYRIATNLMNDHWRRSRREIHDDRNAEEPAAPSPADPDLGMDVESALQALAPRQRALLWLAYVEGYGHREISAIMGVGERSVRVMLFRARNRMAGSLRRAGFDGKEHR
jgi:RNA polymerase sigma-70 factor (ECF subfamily)